MVDAKSSYCTGPGDVAREQSAVSGLTADKKDPDLSDRGEFLTTYLFCRPQYAWQSN